MPSAADLKFLHRVLRVRSGFSIERRHWNHIFTSPVSEVVSGAAAMVHELRKRGIASAIRNRLDLYIRGCGVPPRNRLEHRSRMQA
jgi:hypothetical protein